MGNFPTQPPPELYKYSPNLPHIHLSKVSLHLFHNIQLSLFLLFLIKSRFVLTLIYLSIYLYVYVSGLQCTHLRTMDEWYDLNFKDEGWACFSTLAHFVYSTPLLHLIFIISLHDLNCSLNLLICVLQAVVHLLSFKYTDIIHGVELSTKVCTKDLRRRRWNILPLVKCWIWIAQGSKGWWWKACSAASWLRPPSLCWLQQNWLCSSRSVNPRAFYVLFLIRTLFLFLFLFL